MRLSDDELMARGAAGSQEAFRLLVERWEGPVRAFLTRMLSSPEDAQDLCQDTFLQMVRKADRYEPKGRFRSWLFRIAGNLARSRLRRRRIVSWLSLERLAVDPPMERPSAHREMEDAQSRAAVRRAVAALPDRQREALVLKQYHDLSYKEIATIMGTTVGSIQMLLHRAMTALREDLTRKGDGHES